LKFLFFGIVFLKVVYFLQTSAVRFLSSKSYNMKKTLQFIIFSAVLLKAEAQLFSSEVMTGNRYLFYQHVFAGKIKTDSKLGVSHIANILNWYNHEPNKGGMTNELMNQAYITYQLNRRVVMQGGLFYNNVNGIRPSLAVQFSVPVKHGIILAVPRADVYKKGSFELMGMLEYSPPVNSNMKLYTRFQFMSNAGPYHHNRSYQRLRVGFSRKVVDAGLALNVDEYGTLPKVKWNYGFFLRKVF
jgi:hypothetical protein